MARGRRKTGNPFAGGITLLFLFFVIGKAISDFWQKLSPDLQTIIIIVGPLTLLALIGCLTYYLWRRFRLRKQAWQRAMSNWRQSNKDGKVGEIHSAKFFSPAHLEKFSTELFKQMGYRVIHTGKCGDHGVDVHMINPNGQIELVQCKQWAKPVGEPEVRDLAGAMLHERAIQGFIIAPGGFTQSAKIWARGKNIILVDEHEIGRLVESAFV